MLSCICALTPAVQDGAGLLPAYRGTVDALRQIVRQEGWQALYSGAWARGQAARQAASQEHVMDRIQQHIALMICLLPAHGRTQVAQAKTCRLAAPSLRAGLTPALAGSGLAWGIYFFAYNRAKVGRAVRSYMLHAQRLFPLTSCAQSLYFAQHSLPCLLHNSWGASALPSTLLVLQTTPKQERYQRASGQSKLSPGWHLVSAAEAGAVVSCVVVACCCVRCSEAATRHAQQWQLAGRCCVWVAMGRSSAALPP